MDELQNPESEPVPKPAVDPDTNVKENEDSQKNSDSTDDVSPPENPDQNHEPEPNALTKASPTLESDQKPKDSPTETSSATAEGDSVQDPPIAPTDATITEGDVPTASEPETSPAEATSEAVQGSDTSGEVTKAASEPETTPAEAAEGSDTSGDLTKAASEPETTSADATSEAVEAPDTSGDLTKAPSESETTPAEATSEAAEGPDTSGEVTNATAEGPDTSGDLTKAASEPGTSPAEAAEGPDTSGEVTKAASEPGTSPAEAAEGPDTSGEVTKAASEAETTSAEATSEAVEAPDTSSDLTKAASEPETTSADATSEAVQGSDTSGEVTKAASEAETTSADATSEAVQGSDTSGEVTKAASEAETTSAEATSEAVQGSDTSGEVTNATAEAVEARDTSGDLTKAASEAVDTSMAPTANDVASIEGDPRTVPDDTKKTADEVTLGTAALVDGGNGLTTTATDSTNASDEPKSIYGNSVNVEDETKVPDDIPPTTNVEDLSTSETTEPATSTNTSPETALNSANAEDSAKASLAGSQAGINGTTAVFQDSANTNNEARTGRDDADGKNQVDPVSNQEDLLASPLTNKDDRTSRKSVSVEANEDTVPVPVNNDEDLLQSSKNQIPEKRIDQLVNSRITTASPNDRTNVKSASDDEILRTNETSKTLNRDVEIGTAEEIETLLEPRKPKPTPSQSDDIVDKIMSLSEKFTVVAVIAGILMFLPIAQVVIGSLYKNSCPLNNLIPTYLLVSGILGICLLISIVCMFSIRKKAGKVRDICSFFQYLLGIIYLGWFFVGCVWIFGASTFIQFTNPLDTYYYCDVTVFYGAFITLIITSVLVVIFMCGSCCIRAARLEPDEEV
ncbi:unnamed protein product [Adineta ricciae]|uniref:Uncharacterized protein n=1 Tax=Adineta ricciae TaxID=249248 RepID=A0A814QIS4_ADIRI|nr:unnamed protein product [Adineta ricciae]